jgi:hypothetical protein
MIDAKYVGTPEIARFDFSRINKAGVGKTQARVNKAAEYIWNVYGDKGTEQTPKTFSMLTKKQKLDFLAAHLERVINDAALTQIHNEQDVIANAAVAGVEEDN